MKKWTFAQKREIWLSTETGFSNQDALEDYPEDSIDMDLEGELRSLIIEELSPSRKRSEAERDDEFER